MTSQEAFISALEKLPDEYIERLVDYIDSGKKFTTGVPRSEDGVLGCVGGVSVGLEKLACANTPHYIFDWVDKCVNVIESILKPSSSSFWIIASFNDSNANKSILYQLILKEAERRGLIKKELEKVPKQIVSKEIEV